MFLDIWPYISHELTRAIRFHRNNIYINISFFITGILCFFYIFSTDLQLKKTYFIYEVLDNKLFEKQNHTNGKFIVI